MNLTKTQSKYINNKYLGAQVLRGNSSTGKTVATLHRLANLKNNYSLKQEDKLIYICSNKSELNESIHKFNSIDSDNEYISLLSFIENKVEFVDIESLIDKYFNNLELSRKYINRWVSKEDIISIIEEIIKGFDNPARSKYDKDFFYSEIMWIKACNFNLQQYLEVERKGRKKRLNKNSLMRQFIYSIYKEYNEYMDKNYLLDKYHKLFLILNNSNLIKEKYTHIVLDECREYTLAEIELIRSILTDSGSSITYVLNKDISNKENIWMRKGRKLKEIHNDKCRNYIFKDRFEKDTKLGLIEYDYIDLRGKVDFRFYKDSINHSDEIMIRENNNYENLKENEIDSIPMFNEIAAGEPILINPFMEDIFYMPKYSIKNNGEKFILKVKGDSMEDANINDGDMVLIKKQSTAVNNDIVAVDINGSATLKRLKITRNGAYLKPENIRYDVINLEDKEAMILGIALGVIKEKN